MNEYPAFISRAKAAVIDAVIIVTVLLVTVPLNSFAQSRLSLDQFSGVYLITALLPTFYYVLMQGKWGYTLGKKWTGLYLRMNDGGRVTWRAVVIRYLPSMIYTVVWVVAWSTIVGWLDPDLFRSATLVERGRYVSTVAPSWWPHLDKVMWAWLAVNVLVLLNNGKRRALHDYIAGTVVCYTAKRRTVMANRDMFKRLAKPPKM